MKDVIYKLYVRSVYSSDFLFVHMWQSRSSALGYIKKNPGFDYRIYCVENTWYCGSSYSEKILSVKDYIA